MIIRENYEEEHIRELQSKSRRDPQLIERALYAMGLIEALTKTGMKFIFKGGSCLMVLLPRLMRLSTDIDIIVDPGTDVKEYIEKAAEIFPFVSYEEQVRVGKNNIKKRHFKFTYFSPVRQEDFYILLPRTQNQWICSQRGIGGQLTRGHVLRIKLRTGAVISI